MYLRSILVAAHILLLANGALAEAARPKRIALVIGNGAYEGLPNAMASVADAAEVGKVFRSLSFSHVTTLSDMTHDQFEDAVRDFGKEAVGADWAVVYYAGGGLRVENANYLVPIDVRPLVDLDITTATIPLDSVMQAVAPAKTLRMIILDTARGYSLFSRLKKASTTHMLSEGLAPASENSDLVVYANRRVSVASAEQDRSPLSLALAKTLPLPGLDLATLLGRVRSEVTDATHGADLVFSVGRMPKDSVILSEVNHSSRPASVPQVGSGEHDKPVVTPPSSNCLVFHGEKAC